MKQLLIPTDLADNAEEALSFVLPIAINLEAAIHLINAVDDPFVTHERPVHEETGVEKYTSDLLYKMRTEAETGMQQLVATFQQKLHDLGKNLPVFGYVENGVADKVILDKAAALHPQLIIMGRHKHNRLERLFFGSIAQSVMQKSNYPVLVVPESYQFTTATEVLYLTNLDPNDSYAIGKLLNLLRPFNIKLHLVHFNTSSKDAESSIFAIAEQLKSDYKDINIEYEVIDTKIVHEAWQQYVQHKKIEAIALTGVKHHGIAGLLHQSTSVNVLYQSKLPVFIIPK